MQPTVGLPSNSLSCLQAGLRMDPFPKVRNYKHVRPILKTKIVDHIGATTDVFQTIPYFNY